jgi:hypothetical protein
VAGPDPDQLRLELYEISGPQMTGTFDLAAPPDHNYQTCDRCVLLYADFIDGAPTRYFFQASGTMQLDSVDSPPGPVSAATLTDIQLIEVTIDPTTYVSTPVPGGACLTLDTMTWDTTPVNGTPCQSAEECANPIAQVCDVDTATCADGQCDTATPCAAGELCLTQVQDPIVGACYAECAPFTTGSCPGGFECVNLTLDNTLGACLAVGFNPTSIDCATADITTTCVAGDVCALANGEQQTCLQQCTIFTPSPGCPAGSSCTYGSLCVGPTGSDPAVLDGTCDAAAEFGAPCGPSGGAFRGICFNDNLGDPLMCGRICRLAPGFESDCSVEAYCSDAFGESIGICRNGTIP